MTIASKTVLLQMRFIRGGGAFAEVTAKPGIDTSAISAFQRQGAPFYGVDTEITPPTYSTTRKPVRYGAPFVNTTAKSTIDAHFGKTSYGAPFWVKFDGTSVYVSLKRPIRQGAAFNERVAKDSINAETFDFYRQGSPFWVRYTGSTPPPFNTTRFFLLF